MGRDIADEVRANIRASGVAWGKLGSPLMARLGFLLGTRLRPDTRVAERMLTWPVNREDAMALRFLGGLHRLVLEDRAPDLALAYGDPSCPDEQLWAAMQAVMNRFDDELHAVLDSPPQTNEVRRSAALITAGHILTARFGLPFVISELGASAGLNLLWDHYALVAAGQTFGPTDPVMVLNPDWDGPPLPDVRPQIAEREGVDQNPLDPIRDRSRALSYIWADQHDRLARTKAALDLAAQRKPKVTKMDAVNWLDLRLQKQWPGRLHLICHTIFWQYLHEAARTRALNLLDEAGATATPEAPLAHFGMDNAPDDPPCAAMTLTTWPGGEITDLGRIDFHGRWLHLNAPAFSASRSA